MLDPQGALADTDTSNNRALSRQFSIVTDCFDPLEPNDSIAQAQTLAGILVRIRLLERGSEADDEREELDFLGAELREALEEIRAVARRLRPPELDELGVRFALEALARGLGERTGLRVRLNGDVREESLSSDARLALYRVIQEALTNTVRHARAREVRVEFRPTADRLVTEVVDDGVGFDPSALGSDDASRLGLLNMAERAGYAGGRTLVDSSPGGGTRVLVELPWSTSDAPPGDALDALLREVRMVATESPVRT